MKKGSEERVQQEVQAKLIEKLAALTATDASTINENTNVKKELKVTSLEMSKIISEFEEEYDAYIKYMELMHAETVEELAIAITKNVE